MHVLWNGGESWRTHTDNDVIVLLLAKPAHLVIIFDKGGKSELVDGVDTVL